MKAELYTECVDNVGLDRTRGYMDVLHQRIQTQFVNQGNVPTWDVCSMGKFTE